MNGYFLVRGDGSDGSDRIELGAQTVIGRSDDCDIKVTDGHPSRRHASLTIEADALWVEDLGSANGTFVNERQVAGKTRLHNGDRVAFDLAVFTVAAADADEATVVRSVDETDDATVVRAPPTSADSSPTTAAAPPAGAPVAGAAPATGRAAAEPPAQVPKSWADPDYQPAGTRVLSPEELKAMAAGVAAPGSGPDVAGPHLAVLNGDAAGTVLEFGTAQGEWSVGTDADRALQLADDGISAFHAKISHDNGRWRVIDQMSANGTFVNGDKVTVSYLGNGDRVRFAQVECEIRLPAATTPRAPATAGPSRRRTWLIAGLATAATVGVLALVSLLG